MNLDNIKHKNIGILGFGMEGQAIYKYLTKHEIPTKILEQQEISVYSQNIQALLSNQSAEHLFFGPSYLQGLEHVDVLFVSPGINLANLSVPDRIIITSQTELFFDLCESKIIGITGTKGKGTTSSLIYQILKSSLAAERQVYLTGNIGKIQPLDFVDDLQATDLVVYELSSFQLQRMKQSPHIGVCLMVTEDHLDYHADLNEYHSAKEPICKYQNQEDLCIYNIDYKASNIIGSQGLGQKLMVSKVNKPSNGMFISGDNLLQFDAGKLIAEYNVSNRILRGAHNLENIAPAILVANYFNIPKESIESEVNAFSGLEHRLQFVANKKGISFYNDSISTTPDTAIAAIKSFTEPLVVLLGGSSKGVDFSSLIDYVISAKHIKAVATLGDTGAIIANQLQQQGFDKKLLGNFKDLSKCMQEIMEITNSGDVVLLSPGFASFDMFKNYQDRGNQFIDLVQNI